jgi:hypothetical protein
VHRRLPEDEDAAGAPLRLTRDPQSPTVAPMKKSGIVSLNAPGPGRRAGIPSLWRQAEAVDRAQDAGTGLNHGLSACL